MSAQGSRVRAELDELRQKQLAKNRRDKLKDLRSPLTTPEEAQAFLAAMRDKSHQREVTHLPPSNLSADGMDAWFHKQKEREKEMRQRRREAEALLRNYRSSGEFSFASSSVDAKKRRQSYQTPRLGTPLGPTTPLSAPMEMSEALDDPRSFKPNPVNLRYDLENEADGDVKNGDKNQTNDPKEVPLLTANSSEEEKKLEEKEVVRKEVPQPVEETVWRDFISSEPDAKFPPEAGRYHLYLSYACPGSHRVLIVRALKGLEDVISVTYVHPTWRLTNPNDSTDKHRGWVFGNPDGEPFANTIGRGGPFPAAYQGNEPDPMYNAYSIREIYENANDNSGKYTIPILYDCQERTLVNNDSSDIAYMLNSCFNDFAANPDLDLYTEDDEDGVVRLNEVSEWLSPLMIHGVYRCGFAKNQHAYDKSIAELCTAFDRADDILKTSRYLTGDTLTDADIRLFVTLLRFDEVYAIYFKANARLVMLTPSLLDFCRDIYQIPGIAETCNMEQIKAHFFGSHAEWNKYSVIPRGLGFMELLDMPHNRDELYGDEEEQSEEMHPSKHHESEHRSSRGQNGVHRQDMDALHHHSSEDSHEDDEQHDDDDDEQE